MGHLGSPPPPALYSFDGPDPWDEPEEAPEDLSEHEHDDPWDGITEGVL
jgi:hypothetical protein